MTNSYNIGRILGLVKTLEIDLKLIEDNCINEEVKKYRERTGKRLVKEANERLSEIYKIADELELI